MAMFFYIRNRYKNWSKDTAAIEASFQIQNPAPGQLQLGKLIWQTTNLDAFTENSYCYDDTQRYCQDHGKLYTWEAAQQACLSIGDRWRLPTNREWGKLMVAMGEFYPRYCFLQRFSIR